jgi:hypothetical protein
MPSARIVRLRTLSTSGQRKLPFSRRLAHTHNPLPSHINAFKRVFVLLVNKNKCPLKGREAVTASQRWILPQVIAHQPMQSFETLSHVDGFYRDVDLGSQPYAK